MYQDYIKLKLLIKGRVKNCRLGEVNNIFSDYVAKKYDLYEALILDATSARTADRLIMLKLYDLCMVEIAYCIHNF